VSRRARSDDRAGRRRARTRRGPGRTVRRLGTRLGTWLETARTKALVPAWQVVGPQWGRVRAVLVIVTRTGWIVLAVAVVCWLAARWLGWVEPAMAAGVGLLAVIGALLFTIGRTRLSVGVEVEPDRVVAGSTMYGRMIATNISERRHSAVSVELPILSGAAAGQTAVFPVPGLAASAAHEEGFRLPTHRRGVIDVGPARVVRADPIGLARREMRLTEVRRLYVHPVTTRLEPLGAGFIRDLEGRTTDELSPSDLAFHALREYVPGDDLRHVHWRSSAKMASVSGAATLLVRQYVDTRRSRLALVLSCDRNEYEDEDEFELAVSVMGSIGLRGLTDGLSLTLLAGTREVPCGTGRRLLDSLSEINLAGRGQGLQDAVLTATKVVPDASVVVLGTGTRLGIPRLRLLAGGLGTDPAVIAMRTASKPGTGRSVAGSVALVTLGQLSDLPKVLRSGR
jgi:uncharacterized protein (DUF58 family)